MIIGIIIRLVTYKEKALFYQTYEDVFTEVYLELVSEENVAPGTTLSMHIFKKNSTFYT